LRPQHCQAREIFAAVEDRAVTVALSLGTDPERIARMVEATKASLHLSGGDLSKQTITRIRERVRGTPLMIAVPVEGPESIEVARERAALADNLILDSRAPKEAAVGASGQTHDWNISKRIVAESPVPVVWLALVSPRAAAVLHRSILMQEHLQCSHERFQQFSGNLGCYS
jgi:phosphoribosylanthranilate isomerase